MPEEQGTQVTGEQTPEIVSPASNAAIDTFVDKGSALQEFLSPETIAELNKEHEKLSTPDVDKKNQAPEQKEKEVDPEKIAANEKAKLEADAKAKNEVKDDKKNVFGLNKKKEPKTTDFVIENPDQILDVVKSKFGQEYKAISELPKFFETAQKWRADSQALEKVKGENSDFKEILEGLPSEFIDGIKMHYAGQNYMKAFESKPKFDFNVSADKQDVKSLVNHYFPGKFTEDDFKDGEESPALDIAKTASIDKYNIEKTTRDNQRIQYTEKATKLNEAIKQSVESSVQALSQSFPDVDQDALSDIRSVLDGGREKVMDVFFNKDGTIKQGAAEQIMMALHGKSQIEHMMGIASNMAESRLNEEIVSRGADKPNPTRQASSQEQEIPKELQAKIDELRTIKRKNTF